MSERKKQQKSKALRYKTATFSDSVKTDCAELQQKKQNYNKRIEYKVCSCVSPAEGAVVSAWPFPQVDHCRGATLQSSSAEGSHREA